MNELWPIQGNPYVQDSVTNEKKNQHKKCLKEMFNKECKGLTRTSMAARAVKKREFIVTSVDDCDEQ